MALSSRSTRAVLLGGLAAVTLAGAVVATPAPAEAQWGWRGHYRAAHWGHRPYWGYGRYHRPYWSYRRYHRPYWGGGAVAAGLVGGLALGAIAAQSYPYGYGYGYYPAAYYPRPAYYARPVYYGGYGGCWTERRVRFTPWGERIVRRVRVCG